MQYLKKVLGWLLIHFIGILNIFWQRLINSGKCGCFYFLPLWIDWSIILWQNDVLIYSYNTHTYICMYTLSVYLYTHIYINVYIYVYMYLSSSPKYWPTLFLIIIYDKPLPEVRGWIFFNFSFNLFSDLYFPLQYVDNLVLSLLIVILEPRHLLKNLVFVFFVFSVYVFLST